MTPKISVIMPSLNIANFIDEAVCSVLNQTLKDIEILCIDAGSTDGTLERLERYADIDSRVKIIESDIKSYGYQINLGVNIAVGEYIGIVETDDYILPNMYSDLYEMASKNRLDFVKSDFNKFWWDEEHSIYVHTAASHEGYNVILTEDDRAKFFTYSSLNWTGIYRREYLIKNDIWHSETPGASYQDIGFWLLNMSYAKRAMWLNKSYYMYRQSNPEASMKNRGKMLCSMGEYDRVLSILHEKGNMQAYYECLILKQADYHITFNRIEDATKEEYLEEVAKVYENEKKAIERYVLKDWQEEYFDWIKYAVENKERLCYGIIQDNHRVRSIIDNSEHIYVYGAGQVASRIFMQLYALGYWDDVKNVVVTSIANDKEFYMKEVVVYDNVRMQIGKDDLVILGLGKKNRDEVIDMLHRDGVDKVLVPEEIEGLIYTI